jgi:DNA-binding IclR family transcriptional regulator
LERLKERIGIRHDHTLLLLAIWWGLLELGDPARSKMTIRSIAEKGLRDLAKYFGMIR